MSDTVLINTQTQFIFLFVFQLNWTFQVCRGAANQVKNQKCCFGRLDKDIYSYLQLNSIIFLILLFSTSISFKSSKTSQSSIISSSTCIGRFDNDVSYLQLVKLTFFIFPSSNCFPNTRDIIVQSLMARLLIFKVSFSNGKMLFPLIVNFFNFPFSTSIPLRSSNA